MTNYYQHRFRTDAEVLASVEAGMRAMVFGLLAEQKKARAKIKRLERINAKREK